MIKMFDNIKSLRMGPDSQDRLVASAMISSEGEVMEFRTPVFVEGKVEDWMNDILMEMRRSNRFITKSAIYWYGKVRRKRTEWMMDYQVEVEVEIRFLFDSWFLLGYGLFGR